MEKRKQQGHEEVGGPTPSRASADFPPHGARGNQGASLLALGVLFLLAAALRLFLRNPESLWLDEANSVLIAGRSLGEIVRALNQDGNPPLYYLLLHGWMALFGDGETAVRGLSVLLGSALPPAVFAFARPRLGRAAAWTAAGLVLLSPLHLFYSQQARMYTLLPLLSLLFLHSLLASLEREAAGRGSARCWGLVLLFGAALPYTHNYGLFVLAAAPPIWLVFGPRSRAAFIRLAAVLGAALLAYLPWLPVLLGQARTDVGSWIAASFSARAPLLSLHAFGPFVQLPVSVSNLQLRPLLWTVSAIWVGAALFLGLWVMLRNAATRGTALALLALLLAPIMIPYAVSILGKPIYLAGRYEIAAYPAFACLIGGGMGALLRTARRTREKTRRGGVGAARRPVRGPSPEKGRGLLQDRPGGRDRRRAGEILVASLLAVSYPVIAGLSLAGYRAYRPDRTEERIATSLAGWASPGDAIIVTGLGRAPIEYYLGRADRSGDLRLISFPEETARHPGWYDFTATAHDPEGIEREARRLVDGFASFPGKVFLVDNNSLPEMYSLQEPLRRALLRDSRWHQTLLRAGPGPSALPLYEVSVYTFGP